VASETAGAGESRRYHASARRNRGPGPLRPRRADVADIYDQGASAYEALWSPVILPPAAVLVRSLGLRGRCMIADIGAGTSALLGPIGSAAPAARVVALDASTRMLRIARTRRGASAVLADALALPLADGTVDAVILAYVLFHLADPARAAAEAARVLRPGGRAGIITWAWERQPRASTVWDQVLAEAGVPLAPLRRVNSGLDQPGAVDALLRSAGLRPERIWHDRLHHEWDRSSFWELASGSGSNRIRLSQLSSVARAGVLARLTSTLSQLGPATSCGKARSSALWPPSIPLERIIRERSRYPVATRFGRASCSLRSTSQIIPSVRPPAPGHSSGLASISAARRAVMKSSPHRWLSPPRPSRQAARPYISACRTKLCGGQG
jgi:SAM-dependent methyltransferase